MRAKCRLLHISNPFDEDSEQRSLLDGRVGAIDPSRLLVTCSDFVAA